MYWIPPIVTDDPVAWCPCHGVSVSLFLTLLHPAKAAELIEFLSVEVHRIARYPVFFLDTVRSGSGRIQTLWIRFTGFMC